MADIHRQDKITLDGRGVVGIMVDMIDLRVDTGTRVENASTVEWIFRMTMTKEEFDGMNAWGYCEAGAAVRDKQTGALLTVGCQNKAGFLALVDEKTGKKAPDPDVGR